MKAATITFFSAGLLGFFGWVSTSIIGNAKNLSEVKTFKDEQIRKNNSIDRHQERLEVKIDKLTDKLDQKTEKIILLLKQNQ